MRHILISEDSLLFRPILHVEQYHVVVVEQMKAHFSELDIDNRTEGPRNLDIIKETRENLKSKALALTEIAQNKGQTIRLTELFI